MFMKSNRGDKASDEFDVLSPGETATLDITVTFDFSSSNKDHITYHLKKQTLEVSDDVPVNYHFADDGDTGLTTIVELYEDRDCTKDKKLSKLKYSCGSFSWDKTDADELTEPQKTNYDVLYMKVSTKNELMQTGAVDAANNVTVTVTAPEGFSFEEYELVSEQQINMGTLDVNEERSVSVPVYPIYSEAYNNGDILEFTVKASSSVHSEKTTQEKTVVIEKNAEEGQLFFADTDQKYEKPINAAMFKESSYKYNHELAKLGLALSSMAYRNREEITQSLSNLGFSCIEVHEDADVMFINHSFAKKKIIVDDKVITLLVSPLRGTKNKLEWIGNAWYGDHTNIHHDSFNVARADVYTDLYDYQRTLDFNSNDTRIKLFFCGHSRGAAVANLLATDSFGGIDLEDIYTYTFATPNTTRDDNISIGEYKNIFNIIHYNDIVSMVPLRYELGGMQGFNKYGTTYAFPYELTSGYSKYTSKVYSQYAKYANGSAYDPLTVFDRVKIIKTLVSPLNKWNTLGVLLDTIDFSSKAFDTHMPPTYIAWLEAISGLDDYVVSTVNYKKVDINCPVDVEVYNSSNELVCRIVNNVIDETLPKRIYAEVIGESKTVYLPNDDTYSFKITGNDNGTMDYTVTEYNEEGVKSRVVNFYDIPVENGKTTTSVVNNILNTDVSNYKLSLSDSSVKDYDEEFTGTDIDKITVVVETKGNGYVIGDGSYTKGEYATLYAFENESGFLGWYKDDAIVSTDTEYRFAVTEDITLEARFENVEKVATPVANPNGGIVAFGKQVTLSTATEGATIYYTLDGSVPTASSLKYKDSLRITTKTTIRAIAVKEGMTDSDILTVEYKLESYGGGGQGGTGSGSTGGISQSATVVSTESKNEEWKFTDVQKTDWYYYPVKMVYERGITNGVTETLFAPEENVTRAQFITMLCRAYGVKEMTGDNFADAGNTWYTGYLAAAKQLGISNGTGNNMFEPELAITREEMVTLIYNYLKSIGKTGKEVSTTSYSDDSLISDWARIPVAYSTSVKYINGKEDNRFDPQGNATRAELAQIFFNILTR